MRFLFQNMLTNNGEEQQQQKQSRLLIPSEVAEKEFLARMQDSERLQWEKQKWVPVTVREYVRGKEHEWQCTLKRHCSIHGCKDFMYFHCLMPDYCTVQIFHCEIKKAFYIAVIKPAIIAQKQKAEQQYQFQHKLHAPMKCMLISNNMCDINSSQKSMPVNNNNINISSSQIVPDCPCVCLRLKTGRNVTDPLFCPTCGGVL